MANDANGSTPSFSQISSRRLPRGFTLVELLVVVAIIAILVAISLGVITASIRSAQVAKCSSNLRQIAVGFQGYLADNNNIMPQRYYGSTGTTDGASYYDLLAPYTGNNTTDKSTSVFVCPAHTACNFPSQPSYGMNWYYDNTSVLTVPGLSTTIMVAESAGPNGNGSNRADRDSNDPGELDTTRHRGKSNYLFFDGHIELLTWQNTTTPVDFWGTDQGTHNATAPGSPSP